MQDLFGSGLSNQSFNGLPIDSNWVGDLLDQGWLGSSVVRPRSCSCLIGYAVHPGPRPAPGRGPVPRRLLRRSPRSPRPASATPRRYLLDLAVAAALARRRRTPRPPAHRAGLLMRVDAWCTAATGRWRPAVRTTWSTRSRPRSRRRPRGRPLRAAQRRHRRLVARRQGDAAGPHALQPARARGPRRGPRPEPARRRARAQHLPAAQPVGARRLPRGRRPGGGHAAQLQAALRQR